jgi:hypothetical protein
MPNDSSAASNSALRGLAAESIVAAIADAAERWCDPDFPPRLRATVAVADRLGYSTPVVEFAFDRLFGGMTRDAFAATIVDELGSVGVLDAPVDVPRRPRTWARGVERVTIVASHSTIGVAIPPLAFALCAKCNVTVKDRSDALTAAFLETLAEERAELGEAVDVRTWSGGDAKIERDALGRADVVVAFGRPEALLAIRAACGPDATFVPYGDRASAGYVDRGALRTDLDELAARVARDALLYDGDGCLSLHLLYVERGEPELLEQFIDALPAACNATLVEFPPGARSPRRATAAAHYADVAAFRASTGGGRVARDRASRWSVVVDPPRDQLPPFGAGVIPLYTVTGLNDAAAHVRERRIPIQCVGALDTIDPQALAGAFGAVRIAPLGLMQEPPFAGRHGGRARIADFVRWIDFA